MSRKSVAEQITGRDLALEQVDALIAQRDEARATIKASRSYIFHAGGCPRFAHDWIDSDPCTCGVHAWIERAMAALGESE